MPDVAGCTSVGRIRKNNEDTYRVDEELGLYLVADGMGGAAAGEVASKMAADVVVEALKSAEELSVETLAEAVTLAGLQVQQASRTNMAFAGMGTTMVAAVELSPGRFGVAHVGDSRAYLFDGGLLKQLTTDHTWVEEVGRRLGFSDVDLARHPMRHMLTMALGIEGVIRVPTSTFEPPKGSKLLLSTDGLHGPVAESTIVEILARPEPASVLGEALLGAALEAGGPDNITVVVVCF